MTEGGIFSCMRRLQRNESRMPFQNIGSPTTEGIIAQRMCVRVVPSLAALQRCQHSTARAIALRFVLSGTVLAERVDG